ncbi:hypothetical protein E2562_026531 [Oryza meyeriana var. granulata]|uniref:DUF6598 domain-containing protein n=1 Tax=Oryza meyeriana var. granulata TaxID=110450 RepID=A0A6G1DPY3_9ORYZ|nr:hypothetical protein E2562_026531 [Oryza meyeriana var. granulata]
MADTVTGGEDAATAREQSLPATTTREEVAWEEEKARTVIIDQVGSQSPTECGHRLCPSPCSDDIPWRHVGGSGEMGHVDERCAMDIISASEKMKRGTNCNEELKCHQEKVETKSELKPNPSKNWNKELTGEGKVVKTSVNVISIKVVESDMGYPISIFGTMIARDQHGRDDPQIITSPIKGDEGVDKALGQKLELMDLFS